MNNNRVIGEFIKQNVINQNPSSVSKIGLIFTIICGLIFIGLIIYFFVAPSKKLNIDRKIISYRLKSSHFKNYLYKDNDINIKNKKFIDIDPYLSKKERISIDNKIYESITDATKELNKTHDYINWRLNSKSYPNWSYLDKVVELKETGIPKLKSVSINGIIYESISNAVIGSGIDRQVMRYRLKSKNYPEYFYI